jgi:acetolactate synthase-1/2/3 large subunit
MTGADYLIETLVKTGASFFTFPGGCIAPLYDALQRRGIMPFVARHEQGAGYASLAKSRILQKPQVIMVTSGPGVTNLLTVIADAYFDSTPLIVLAGQVGTADITSRRPVRQRGFQQVDTPSLVQSISKACYQPLSVEEIPVMLRNALITTVNKRPGPVVLDLPMDVQRAEFSSKPETLSHVWPERDNYLPSAEFLSAQQALEQSIKPLIVAGQGTLLSGSSELLRIFAKMHSIPVTSTLLGLGAMDSGNPLHLGFAGHTGLQLPARALQQADCVFVLGSRLDIRQTGTLTDDYCRSANAIIHVDIDENELLHPRVKTTIKIHADIKIFLSLMLNSATCTDDRLLRRKEWIQTLLENNPTRKCKCKGNLRPEDVIKCADTLTHGERVAVTTGVGSHQHWTARNFTFNAPDRLLLTSGGHGTMGYDLPSAVGAALTEKVQKVLCFVGDASFQMNIQELQTIVEYNLPIKIFVLDNKRMALVSQFQKLTWRSDPTTGNVLNPSFTKIAEAYGLNGMDVHSAAELTAPCLRRLIASDKPALFHCHIDADADISPILLAGDKLDAMSV